MARARNIKPGFFANENLAECDPLARLLFAGLWCLADREGRLEDRPKRIRAELLPYDTCDADELLNQLQAKGFILRYSHGEGRFIQVLKFGSHQNPHIKEAKSSIPAPGAPIAEPGRQIPTTGQAPEQHSTSTVQAPDQNHKSPADSGFLNPDSLIPDSMTEAKASLSASAKPTDDEPDDGVPPCPFDKLIDSYKKHLPELPDVRRSLFAGGKNGKAMRSRWRWVLTAKHERGQRIGERLAESAQDGLAWFDRYFAYVADSDFLTGKSGAFTGCDLGWLVNAANFEKVLSGKYHAEKREAANA